MKRLLLLSLSCVSFSLFSADDGRGVEPASVARSSVTHGSAAGNSEAEVAPREVAGAIAASDKTSKTSNTCLIRFQEDVNTDGSIIFSTEIYKYDLKKIKEFSKFLESYTNLPEADGTYKVAIIKTDFDVLFNNDFSNHTTLDDFIRLFKAADYLDVLSKYLPTNYTKIQMISFIIIKITHLNNKVPEELQLLPLYKEINLRHLFLNSLKKYKQMYTTYEIRNKTIEQIADDIGLPIEFMLDTKFSVQDLIDCKLIPEMVNDEGTIVLNLSGLNLSSFDEGVMNIPNIITVNYINLGGNHLTEFSITPESFPALTHLNLENNQLTQFSMVDQSFPMLTVLNIRRNCLTEFSITPGSFPALQLLDLSKNKLTQFPMTPDLFPALQILDLENNCLRKFDAEINAFPALINLNLKKNKLTEFSLDNGPFPILISLNLENNKLTEFFLMEALPTLTLLDLTNNYLEKTTLEFPMEPFIPNAIVHLYPQNKSWKSYMLERYLRREPSLRRYALSYITGFILGSNIKVNTIALLPVSIVLATIASSEFGSFVDSILDELQDG